MVLITQEHCWDSRMATLIPPIGKTEPTGLTAYCLFGHEHSDRSCVITPQAASRWATLPGSEGRESVNVEP
jgi:hypothetical protein